MTRTQPAGATQHSREIVRVQAVVGTREETRELLNYTDLQRHTQSPLEEEEKKSLSDARTHDVPGVTVTALGRKVVIKFISSFRGRGKFSSKPPFCARVRECACVRVCVYMRVCVCLPACPQQLSALETVCVVSFWTALNFPKKICLRLQGKSGAGAGIRLFFFSPGADDCSFASRDLCFKDKTPPPSDTFLRESREQSRVYGWCFVGYGEGAVPFLSPLPLPFFPLIRIPALMAGVDFRRHAWKSRISPLRHRVVF